VIALFLALVGAYGVHLAYTAVVFRWHGVSPGPAPVLTGSWRASLSGRLRRAGFEGARPAEVMAVVAVTASVGASLGYALFGGVLPPLAGAAAGTALPPVAGRARRERRAEQAREAWPRMIEEIRIRATTVGRSLPQALFETGERGSADMQPAFDAARREWLLGTDFARAVAVLKAELADATADTVCETLLVANEIGGTDVDRCLAALADDRMQDLQSRKDARSQQAGARFARRFVLVVPLGMAVVGLTIGSGRAAYKTPAGQLLVLAGLAMIASCWVWAGRIMRLPAEQRVFGQ
jgi:tight adherence protein B